MNELEIAAVMPTDIPEAVLQEVSIAGTLSGLYSEVEVTQCYFNPGDTNIETVLTLALPQEAVLLGVDLTIGERRLEGAVKARKQAEHDYEEAVCEGDSALMVVEVEPGIFSITLANLLPQEKAVVRFRYAELHRWAGDTLRFYLPLTLAPRYGSPDPLQFPADLQPTWSFDTAHNFQLALNIEGLLAQGDLDCPSHPAQIDAHEGGLKLTVDGPADTLMNRDFILNFAKPEFTPATLTVVPDGEQRLAHACIQPTRTAIEGGAPRCFQILVDCSGSMAGDSIVQARRAIVEILNRLAPEDMFNITRFGSTQEGLAPFPIRATEAQLLVAQKFIASMDADLGGTELDAAFEHVYSQLSIDTLTMEILLITDGHVHRPDLITERAAQRPCRVFSIGVGSSVSEGVLATLARQTGGHMELVSPREGLGDRIIRQFERMRQPKATHAKLDWDAHPSREVDADLLQFFRGDTLHLFAFFPESEEAPTRCTLTVEFDDGQSLRLVARPGGAGPVSLQESLPRMAIAHELRNAQDPEPELAEQYQILCKGTAYVLTMPRAEGEKATDLPALQKIPHVTPAGFGGMGSSLSVDANIMYLEESSEELRLQEYLYEPAFLRRQADGPADHDGGTSDGFIAPNADHPTGWRFGTRKRRNHAQRSSKRRLKRMVEALRGLGKQPASEDPTTQDDGTVPQILEEAELDALIVALNEFVADTPDQADIARACRSLMALYAAVEVPYPVMNWIRDLSQSNAKGEASAPEATVITALIHWLCEHRGVRFERTARRRLMRALPMQTLEAETMQTVSARLPEV